MDVFDPDVIHDRLSRYQKQEPFVQVEDDRLQTLPDAFADKSYLWKDVEWIVRWYCRRPLTNTSRDAEATFRQNGMNEIRWAIRQTLQSNSLSQQLAVLTQLAGVDVPIAGAFLQYIDPNRYVTIDEHAWSVLVDAGLLEMPYPDPPNSSDYSEYLQICRDIAATADVRTVDVGRALWADAR